MGTKKQNQKEIPWWKAGYLSHEKCDLDELIQKGTTKEKITVLHHAATHGSMDIVKYLYDRGVPVNPDSNKAKQALIGAAAHGEVKGVKFLLDQGVHPWCKCGYHESALHCAAMECGKQYYTIMKMLLDVGADPLRKNKNGQKPLDLARNPPPYINAEPTEEDKKYYQKKVKYLEKWIRNEEWKYTGFEVAKGPVYMKKFSNLHLLVSGRWIADRIKNPNIKRAAFEILAGSYRKIGDEKQENKLLKEIKDITSSTSDHMTTLASEYKDDIQSFKQYYKNQEYKKAITILKKIPSKDFQKYMIIEQFIQNTDLKNIHPNFSLIWLYLRGELKIPFSIPLNEYVDSDFGNGGWYETGMSRMNVGEYVYMFYACQSMLLNPFPIAKIMKLKRIKVQKRCVAVKETHITVCEDPQVLALNHDIPNKVIKRYEKIIKLGIRPLMKHWNNHSGSHEVVRDIEKLSGMKMW